MPQAPSNANVPPDDRWGVVDRLPAGLLRVSLLVAGGSVVAAVVAGARGSDDASVGCDATGRDASSGDAICPGGASRGAASHDDGDIFCDGSRSEP